MPGKNATDAVQSQPVSAPPEITEHHDDVLPASVAEIQDPKSVMRASLGEGKDAPKLELLRSHRFNQMQLRAEEPLSEKHQELLKDAGWRDRTEAEGIYTKQLPKEGEKWRQAADAERLFKQIANEVRADKGLSAVMAM